MLLGFIIGIGLAVFMSILAQWVFMELAGFTLYILGLLLGYFLINLKVSLILLTSAYSNPCTNLLARPFSDNQFSLTT